MNITEINSDNMSNLFAYSRSYHLVMCRHLTKNLWHEYNCILPVVNKIVICSQTVDVLPLLLVRSQHVNKVEATSHDTLKAMIHQHISYRLQANMNETSCVLLTVIGSF